jgi:sugar O-acyltransferase (sialic acid O-acetyltransferase NeuD family)
MNQPDFDVTIGSSMTSHETQVVLFGASEHARVVADIARRAGCTVVALVDEDRAKRGLDGVPILHDAGEAARRYSDARWCVSIGDNHRRESVVARLGGLLATLRFIALVHPSAVVAQDATIGEGTVVMAGAVINPGTTIGRHCVVNTGACIDHDNRLDDFCSVAPRVATGGKVSIGRGSAVCIGACIQHGVNVGEHTVIGAGSVVLGDVPARCVAFGVPCKVIRDRRPSDRYL